jgi:hypothetical protein
MTRNEFHIALVLIALIAAGVLGYDFLNSKQYSYSQSADCTLALYFSGPDGCQNRPAVRSISGPVFVNKIEAYFSRDELKQRYLQMYVDKPAAEKTLLDVGEVDKHESNRVSTLRPDSIKAGSRN